MKRHIWIFLFLGVLLLTGMLFSLFDQITCCTVDWEWTPQSLPLNTSTPTPAHGWWKDMPTPASLERDP